MSAKPAEASLTPDRRAWLKALATNTPTEAALVLGGGVFEILSVAVDPLFSSTLIEQKPPSHKGYFIPRKFSAAMGKLFGRDAYLIPVTEEIRKAVALDSYRKQLNGVRWSELPNEAILGVAKVLGLEVLPRERF